MKNEDIARVVHEALRAYGGVVGAEALPPWDEAPDWQRSSTLAVVAMHLAHPEAGPEACHEAWMAEKLAAGWRYGPVKDPARREHPCLVPFAALSPSEQTKDVLFQAIVRALAG